jgi:hypothetical protein
MRYVDDDADVEFFVNIDEDEIPVEPVKATIQTSGMLPERGELMPLCAALSSKITIYLEKP